MSLCCVCRISIRHSQTSAGHGVGLGTSAYTPQITANRRGPARVRKGALGGSRGGAVRYVLYESFPLRLHTMETRCWQKAKNYKESITDTLANGLTVQGHIHVIIHTFRRQYATIMDLYREIGTDEKDIFAITGCIVSTASGLLSTLDHLARFVDRQSIQESAETIDAPGEPVYFFRSEFNHPKFEYIRELQQTLSKPLWNGRSFNQIANYGKHETPYFGTLKMHPKQWRRDIFDNGRFHGPGTNSIYNDEHPQMHGLIEGIGRVYSTIARALEHTADLYDCKTTLPGFSNWPYFK